MGKAWNPRYVCYARCHGKTPEEMLTHDRGLYPGGVMLGFMRWIQRMWTEWGKTPEHGGKFPDASRVSDAAHRDFDAWLESSMEARRAKRQSEETSEP